MISGVEKDWDAQARDWVAWVRRPGLDSYWRYRSDFFDLTPGPGLATLDQGCGEGRVSRDLAGLGHRVTGVDASPAMVAAAREADPAGRYLVSDGAELPFPDGTFDLVVSYNVLMDTSDVAGVVREASRVLVPGGRMCVSITHPLTNPGDRDRPYFESTRFSAEEEQDGLRMMFTGWSHPLGTYTGALERAGLLIEAVREPAWRDHPAPYLLWLRAVRPA